MYFAKVKLDNPQYIKPIDYGWMLKIRSLEDLLEYFMGGWEKTTSVVWKDFRNLERLKDYDHLTDLRSFSVGFLAEMKGTSVAEALSELIGEKFSLMSRRFPVFVNEVGGWFGEIEHLKETGGTESDRWPENEHKPEYKQWPGGKHWYCKVGGQDVVVDDKQKWNTLEGAKRAYKKWSKENK